MVTVLVLVLVGMFAGGRGPDGETGRVPGQPGDGSLHGPALKQNLIRPAGVCHTPSNQITGPIFSFTALGKYLMYFFFKKNKEA